MWSRMNGWFNIYNLKYKNWKGISNLKVDGNDLFCFWVVCIRCDGNGCMLPFARLQTNKDRDDWWHWTHWLAETPTRHSLCCWSHGWWFHPQLTMEIHTQCAHTLVNIIVWCVMQIWKHLKHSWNSYVLYTSFNHWWSLYCTRFGCSCFCLVSLVKW